MNHHSFKHELLSCF